MKTWKERIDEARVRGRFTEEDVRLSGSFRTCAVGEKMMAEGVTYFSDQSPLHPDIERLGLLFCEMVCSDNVRKAKTTYREIYRLKGVES